MLSQSPCRFSYVVAHKLCGFKQNFRCVILYFAVKPAHNACKSNGFVAVAYDEIFRIKLEFVSVERRNLFTVLSSAYQYLSARKRPQIEGVHRLSEFKQNKVRNIDYVVYRTQSAQRKLLFKPTGGRGNFNVLYVMSDISRAKLRRKVRNFYFGIIAFDCVKRTVGLSYRFSQNRRNFACDSENTLAVGSVCGYRNIENVVVKSENGLYVATVFAVGRKNKKPAVVAAFEHISVYAQFRTGTKHTVGLYTA